MLYAIRRPNASLHTPATDCGLVIFDFRLVVEVKRFTRQCAGYDYQALHDVLDFAHRAWLQACLENPQSKIFSPQFWAPETASRILAAAA